MAKRKIPNMTTGGVEEIDDKDPANFGVGAAISEPPADQNEREAIRREITDYGFKYGAAEVTRIHADESKGYVLIAVKSPKDELQIYVTRTGKIRVWNYKTGQELKPTLKASKENK